MFINIVPKIIYFRLIQQRLRQQKKGKTHHKMVTVKEIMVPQQGNYSMRAVGKEQQPYLRSSLVHISCYQA